MTKSSPHMAAHRRTRFPGKTFFLDFILARLISAKQVVLMYTKSATLLFYQEKVYKQEPAFFSCLPRHKLDRFFHVWALINADSDTQPSIKPSHNIWPVQASSPKPTRWKGWSKQRAAIVLGMPLWNVEELKEGYVSAA